MSKEKEIKNVLIRDISKEDSDLINAVKKLSGKGSATKALLWAAENVKKKERERASFEKKYEDLMHYVLTMENGLEAKENAEKQILSARKQLKKQTEGNYYNRYR